MAITDDEIIRQRLLVDERPLKRLIKKFYSLASCPQAELDVHYAQFVLELDSQDVLSSTKSRTTHIASQEIQTYDKEVERIEAETREAEETIVSLKEQLVLAQQTRKNKIVYDSIAKEALKLPSRAHSAENIVRLTAELRELEVEQKRYAETWAGRQQAFGAIVKGLEELQERVREEKSEQERRDALGDDDVAEETSGQTRSAEESEADDEIVVRQLQGKALDPTAKSFQPSPLKQQSALDAASPLPPSEGQSDAKTAISEAASARMEVDEDVEVPGSNDAATKEQSQRHRSRSNSREEGEDDGEEAPGDGAEVMQS